MSIKSQSVKLSPQAYAVLDELKFQYGYCFIHRLAANLRISVPSVRRAVQELRRAGYDIHLNNEFLNLTASKPKPFRCL